MSPAIVTESIIIFEGLIRFGDIFLESSGKFNSVLETIPFA